jgi:hypothetical protein
VDVPPPARLAGLGLFRGEQVRPGLRLEAGGSVQGDLGDRREPSGRRGRPAGQDRVLNGRERLGGQVGGGLDRGHSALEALGYRLELGDGSLALIAAEQVRLEVAGVIRVQGAQDPPGHLGVVEGVLDVIGQ